MPHLLLLTTHFCHPFFPKLPELSPIRPNPRDLGRPLSRVSRPWISCGISHTNLKLPCFVLMRVLPLLAPLQGLPKLPESRRSADFPLRHPNPLQNPWLPLCLPPGQLPHWTNPFGGQSLPHPLSLTETIKSLSGALLPLPVPVVSKWPGPGSQPPEQGCRLTSGGLGQGTSEQGIGPRTKQWSLESQKFLLLCPTGFLPTSEADCRLPLARDSVCPQLPQLPAGAFKPIISALESSLYFLACVASPRRGLSRLLFFVLHLCFSLWAAL